MAFNLDFMLRPSSLLILSCLSSGFIFAYLYIDNMHIIMVKQGMFPIFVYHFDM